MKSIKLKLILIIVTVLLSYALLLLVANTFLLDDYYVYKTKNSFMDTGYTIQSEFRDNKEGVSETIKAIHNETGYKIEIIDSDYKTIYSSAPEFESLKENTINKDISNIIGNKLTGSKDNFYYSVHENSDESFVMLVTRLNKEDYIIITQPLNQIIKSAKVANDFLWILGSIVLVFSIIIAVIFSKRMVNPILDIKDIADSIAKLDFSKVYLGRNKDEIGELGNSINNISQKLNKAINELNYKNEQLIDEMKLQKRFVASVSHEFNTPVGLIRGYSEALQLEMYSSEQEKMDMIGIIIKEADRLSHLVGDILLLMKMDSKIFKLKKNDIDIVKLIMDSCEKVEIKAKEKNIRLKKNINEHVLVYVDSIRITQVIDNLLSNAITHTPNGGEITITNRVEDENLKVLIENTGSIILDEDKKHLFDPFYRAESSRTRHKGGSGLGLSIVASIISAHSGDYGVDNTEHGVMFWFDIPIKKI